MKRMPGSPVHQSILSLAIVLVLVLVSGCGVFKSREENFTEVSQGLSPGEEAEEVEEESAGAPAPGAAKPPSDGSGGSAPAPGDDTDAMPAPAPSPAPALSSAEKGDMDEGMSDAPAAGRAEERGEDRAESETAPMEEAESYEEADDEAMPTRPETEPDEVRRPQGRPAPLKAGERDDNEMFQDYLNYLETYDGQPALSADVSERYIMTVSNENQDPLFNATVRVFDGQEQVFVGRTYAGGETIFLPRVHGVSANANEFRVVAEYGNATAETTIDREEREEIELIIADARPSEDLHLDVLFLLDTTGSMSDELSRIQETIDSIAQRIDQFVPRPELRFGLVAYRDRGDDYVTRSYDFSSDVEAFRKVLNSFSAGGGGDGPESLNEGLHDAIHDVDWSDKAVRLIFLVADAGPHLDYEQDYDYLTEVQHAVEKGIKIYPIAASNTDPYAEYVFRQLAQQTLARFVFLTYQAGQSEGVPGESTTLESGDQPYTVERLDDLIVQIVQRELASARGQR